VRSLISKLRLDRIVKVLSGKTETSQTDPVEVITSLEAVAVLENLVSDALVRNSLNEESSGSVSGTNLSGMNAFGRQVTEIRAESVTESLATASGIALAGSRVSSFFTGDRILEGYQQIQFIADHHIPMVLYPLLREGFGPGSNHAGYHGVADIGLFQIMPHTVQQAADYAILAHWLAERSLVPGIVGIDRNRIESASLLPAEKLRTFLGAADSSLTSPTPSQLLLFSGERRQVPAWFDQDRPVSIGAQQGSSEGASRAAGNQAFFFSHLQKLAKEGMASLAEVTGRPLSFVYEENLKSADTVIVTQGTAVQTASAAAKLMNSRKGSKVGVLGITWLRPFPVEEVKNALTGKRKVLVLESLNAPLAGTLPLLREIQGCLSGGRQTWMSGSYGMNGQPLNVGQVVDLLAELQGSSPRDHVWLGITSGREDSSDFPKREGLINAVKGDYPELAANTVKPADPVAAEAGSKTVLWIGPNTMELSEILSGLAEACTVYGSARGYGWSPEAGVLAARVTAGGADQQVAEAGGGVDVLWLGKTGLDVIFNPLEDMVKGGTIIVHSERPADEIWTLTPDYWRDQIKRLGLKMYCTARDYEETILVLKDIIAGETDLQPVNWQELGEPEVVEEGVPGGIRKFSEPGNEYDNLPRFWGELMQPKRGGSSDNFPDPLVTLNAIPSYTAALARPRATAMPFMPELADGKNAISGTSWAVCPDSAIGATLISINGLLDALSANTGEEGKLANAVKRAHRSITQGITAAIVKNPSVELTYHYILGVYDELVPKLRVADADKEEHRRIFARTVFAFEKLNPIVTEDYFLKPEKLSKGSGLLLAVAFNPDSCQGCQLCIKNSPEGALKPVSRVARAKEAREVWSIWEELPATGSENIKRALETGMDPVAARLLDRNSSQTQAVGSFGLPGSGERLASRLVTSLAESVMAVNFASYADKADETADSLQELVNGMLEEGKPRDGKKVAEALRTVSRRRVNRSELDGLLEKAGLSSSLDPAKLLERQDTVNELKETASLVRDGANGVKRAHFSVAVIGDRISRWAGRFPNHPYNAPLLVDLSPEGMQTVSGVARALAQKHINEVRLQRKGMLYLEAPTDLPAKIEELDSLTWDKLTAEEKSYCAPLVVLCDETSLDRQGVSGLTGILNSGLPVKLVLLDSCDITRDGVDPLFLGLSCQDVFIFSGSLGDFDSFADGINRAISWTGSSLIRIHVPLPQEHGFRPALTIDRARAAVKSGILPVVTYDPGIRGEFTSRLSFATEPLANTAAILEWAAGEERYKRFFSGPGDKTNLLDLEVYLEMKPEERGSAIPSIIDPAGSGEMLIAPELLKAALRVTGIMIACRELSGHENPEADKLRVELKDRTEAEKARSAEVEEMKKTYEVKIAELEANVSGQMAEKLRARLLSLAGFGSSDS
jgi:pyruvate/2-oxoacid:ferredoxin oxidoreductase alpha subunit/NAD-dependent dihydropyrimidine dehydrogenase PreA subunit